MYKTQSADILAKGRTAVMQSLVTLSTSQSGTHDAKSTNHWVAAQVTTGDADPVDVKTDA